MRKLHWSLLKRLYRLGPRFAVYKRLGREWLLDNRNWVDQQLIIRRPYEFAQLQRCREVIARHGVTHFFDIGANFGLYSVLLADEPSLQAIEAFEPLPRNIHQLGANLYLNGIDERVRVHPVALNDCDASMTLHVDERSTGISTLNPETLGRDRVAWGTHIQVETRRLDGMIDLKDTTVLAKIDVEGAELKVLQGMEDFLAANRVHLQIETTPATREDVDSFMGQAGYRQVDRIGADSYYVRVDS